MNLRISRLLIPALLLSLVGVPSSLLVAQESERAAEAPVDPFGDSPFADDEEEERRLPLGEDPETSEVLPALIPVIPESDLRPPSGAIRLAFNFDESYRMDVNNTSRMGFDQRPDLRQVYHSGMALEYSPIDDATRESLPTWRIGAPEEDIPDDARPVLVTAYEFSGSFESPRELRDSARTQQILKDAAVSFRITPQGRIYDFRVHSPTNPLARSSFEDLMDLISASHPLLPAEPIAPGHTWSQNIEIRVEDNAVVKTQDVTLNYRFDRWGRCDSHYCAVIEIEQDVQAAGRMLDGDYETRSATVGSSEGWILFDHETGRVVRSRFELDAQGNTAARRRVGDEIQELATARFNMNVITRMELLDRRLPSYELVPLERD